MAKDALEKLKEIIGENATLGMDSAEEDWDSEKTQEKETDGLDSFE